MASCDPDGRIAEAIRDRLACMVMDWRWQIEDKVAEVEAMLPDD